MIRLILVKSCSSATAGASFKLFHGRSDLLKLEIARYLLEFLLVACFFFS